MLKSQGDPSQWIWMNVRMPPASQFWRPCDYGKYVKRPLNSNIEKSEIIRTSIFMLIMPQRGEVTNTNIISAHCDRNGVDPQYLQLEKHSPPPPQNSKRK